MSSTLYALLVGIDRYENPAEAPHLRGCVTDVLGTQHFLCEQLGLPSENVRLLTARMDQSEAAEDRATRANILQAWQDHFGKAQSGDQVFFNYSGHGAQARSINPNEPSGYDETIVPHDSRTPGVFDILDKELAKLIEQLEKRGVQVTIFLDCCHSGSGTRATASSTQSADAPKVRRCQPDERRRPLSSVLVGVADTVSAASTRSSMTRSASGWIPLGNHVLLAGCRDEELSHEYQSPETGEWHGATTYFFHKLMASYRPNMTWADVHDFVQTNVHAVYPAQSPQLEGPANLQIFGGIAAEFGRALVVSEVDGEHFVKLSGGITTGLAVGAKVAIYPPASNLAGEPVAVGVVDEVKVDHAWVKLDQPTAVERASRVKITNFAFSDQSILIAVEDLSGQHGEAVEEIRRRIGAGDSGESGSAFLQLHHADRAERLAQYVVQVVDGRYCVTDATGAQILDAMPSAAPAEMAESAAQIVRNLEHIAIYNNVLTLSNPSVDSRLSGAVSIEGAVTFTKRQRNNMPADPTELVKSGNVASVTDGEKLFFELVNNSEDDLYLALFKLTPDFGVIKLHPPRAGYERVAAGKRIQIHSNKVSLDNPNLASGRQVYKVIASSEPIDYSVLALPELNQESREERAQAGTRATGSSALAQLLNRTRHDGTRGASLLLDETDDQWTTAQFEISILAAEQAQTLDAGETTATLEAQSLQVMLEKPASFEAAVRIGSAAQSMRADGSVALLPPAMRNPDIQRYFEPLMIGASTRAASPSPVVVTLDGNQLASITSDTPLTLDVEVGDEPDLVGLLPIAFDGEYYYVVGETVSITDADETNADLPNTAAKTRSGARSSRSTRQVTVSIEQLPATILNAEGDDAATGTRSIGRTARLFFYKMFFRELPTDTGLRKAELDADGEVFYAPVTPADVAAATRIGLLVHGINSDTMWMVENIWPLVEPERQYDLCLTYDYESFGTSIMDNGLALHHALEAVGFGADDGAHVDVFAHSMGSQVMRAVVERFGGQRYVDRVFMGGAPNAGSPLVKSRKLIPWLGTILINQVGAVPAALVINWFLRKSVEAGVGLSDLDPSSDFYKELNRPGNDPVSVPYFIQMGNYSTLAQGREHDPNFIHLFRRLGGLGDAGLDAIFGDDHDLAVGISSARAIENSSWPNVQIQELGVTHWGYFHTEDGWTSLKKWLNT